MDEGESPSAIKYRLNPNELASLQSLFDPSEVGDYFKNISNSSISSQMLSSHYASKVLEGLERQLQKGRLDIAEQSEAVDALMD